MIWREDLERFTPSSDDRIVVIEAARGSITDTYLDTWMRRKASSGGNVWRLPCSFESGGAWAGVKDLLSNLVSGATTASADLIAEHSPELSLVLPLLRRTLTSRHRTLTDSAPSGEKVRNYPRDRAYRIVHGLVEFVSALLECEDRLRPVFVCNGFSEAGELTRLFFLDLLRRRGLAQQIPLVMVNEPGTTDLAALASVAGTAQFFRPNLPKNDDEATDPHPDLSARARELERLVAADSLLREEHLAELVRCWANSDTPEASWTWRAYSFTYCHHYGLYDAALRYATTVLEHLDFILDTNSFFRRWDLVGTICDDYLAVGQPEAALQLVKKEGLAKIDDPKDRVKMFYAMAMINARFLTKPDFPAAEEYIAKALQILDMIELEPNEAAILRVFTQNGLAFVRHRQGRPEEAIELCRRGYDLLDRTLAPEEHRLHRSVLLYNIGQVYTGLRRFAEAVPYYSAAIESDPNYSEYYNERGSLYLNLGRFDEAIEDYRTAIHMSPPYPEVWTNLGQVYKLKGDAGAAVDAYSRALELEPSKLLAWLGRAQAHDELGELQAAVTDYSTALAISPGSPEALSNRASVLLALGQPEDALRDLDAAVALGSDAVLHYNRAHVLAQLGRQSEAIKDLGIYLALQPDAPDRDQVCAWLTEYSARASESLFS